MGHFTTCLIFKVNAKLIDRTKWPTIMQNSNISLEELLSFAKISKASKLANLIYEINEYLIIKYIIHLYWQTTNCAFIYEISEHLIIE